MSGYFRTSYGPPGFHPSQSRILPPPTIYSDRHHAVAASEVGVPPYRTSSTQNRLLTPTPFPILDDSPMIQQYETVHLPQRTRPSLYANLSPPSAFFSTPTHPSQMIGDAGMYIPLSKSR